jgi:hypothetical protein
MAANRTGNPACRPVELGGYYEDNPECLMWGSRFSADVNAK